MSLYKLLSVAIVLILLSYNKIIGQEKLNIDLRGSFSITKPDKRTYENTNAFESRLLSKDRPSYLNEFIFNISKVIKLRNSTFLSAGIGSSTVFNDVDRLINNYYFYPDQQVIQLVGHINGWYLNTSIQPTIGIMRKFSSTSNWDAYLGVENAFSLSLFKSMYSSGLPLEKRFSRSTFEPFANELFVNTRIQRKRIAYHFDVRIFNLKFVDEALKNSGKKNDINNPIKLRLSLSYSLFKSQ